MNNLNSVLLEGSLVSAPDLRYVDNHPLTKFDVRSERTSGEIVTTVSVIGRLAELCAERLFEGSKVRVVGHLHYADSFTACSGERLRLIGVMAEHVEFVRSPLIFSQEEIEAAAEPDPAEAAYEAART